MGHGYDITRNNPYASLLDIRGARVGHASADAHDAWWCDECDPGPRRERDEEVAS